MESYDLFGFMGQGVRLLIALVEALCAIAILVRFRFKPAAYLAAVAFLGYAFLDFVYIVTELAHLWSYSWFHAVDLLFKAFIVITTLMMAIGLAILGISAAKGGAQP